jgi:hypothetical protein
VSKKLVKTATDRAVKQAASRGGVVARPGAALLGELGLSVALHELPDPESVVWLTPALAVSTTVLSALLWHIGRDRSTVGRALAVGSTVLAGIHLIAASVVGPFSDPLLGLWLWGGGTTAAAWVVRLWIARGNAQIEEGKARVSMWDEIAKKAGGAFENSGFRPRQADEARMKGSLQLEPGQVVDDAQAGRKQLASLLGLPPNGVRITPDPDDASRGEMTLTRKDLLRHPRPYEGPSAVGDTVVTPYLVGYYESGEPALLPTHVEGGGERHLLIQGMNGAGKTQGAYLIFGEEFTRRENFTIYIDTVKGAQSLGPIARGLRWVIQTEAEAHALMRKLIKNVIPARANYLGRKGLKNWQPGCGIPRLVVHVEEGSGLFLGNKDFTRALERIRSVGIQFRLSGQRFSYTSVDVSARAQFAAVWCFGVSELDDARFVMPEEAIDAGADPSQWKNERPGCAYLIAPGIEKELHVTPMRTLWVEDEQLQLLAEYAHRNGAELDPVTAEAFGELYTSRVPVEQMLADGAPLPVVDDEDEEDEPVDRDDEPELEPAWRPTGEDPAPEVQPAIDEPLERVASTLRFGAPEPEPKPTPEQAAQMLETRLASLQAEGRAEVRAADLAEVARVAGRSPAWVYKQLRRRVESGHLVRTDSGFAFARALTNA